MAVAHSYEKYNLIGEPFEENKRMYIYIQTPKGNKKVRWYTDAARARMDKTQSTTSSISTLMDFNAKHAFGFDEAGYITIYQGDEEEIERWAQYNMRQLRYNLTFRYYTPSRLTLPAYPPTIMPIRLNWTEVAADDTRMRPHEEIAALVEKKIRPMQLTSTSVYQGVIGEWVTQDLIVLTNVTKMDQYGEKHYLTFIDENANQYLWITGTKNYEVGTQISLKMKVKAHQIIKNNNTTVVWYCKEI